MTVLRVVFLLLAATLASCATPGSDYGGNQVEVEIRCIADSGSSASTPFSVRGWVLNAPGLKELGGRDRLTGFGTLLQQEGPGSQDVIDARKKLVADLDRLALHRLRSSEQTVKIEPKLHTVVVEHDSELRHDYVNVVKLKKPYGFDLKL